MKYLFGAALMGGIVKNWPLYPVALVLAIYGGVVACHEHPKLFGGAMLVVGFWGLISSLNVLFGWWGE